MHRRDIAIAGIGFLLLFPAAGCSHSQKEEVKAEEEEAGLAAEKEKLQAEVEKTNTEVSALAGKRTKTEKEIAEKEKSSGLLFDDTGVVAPAGLVSAGLPEGVYLVLSLEKADGEVSPKLSKQKEADGRAVFKGTSRMTRKDKEEKNEKHEKHQKGK